MSAKREEIVKGVRYMSAQASEATEQIHEILPGEMDMEMFIGIVGNLCLALGIKGRNLRTFVRGLTEFVELMDEQIKKSRH